MGCDIARRNCISHFRAVQLCPDQYIETRVILKSHRLSFLITLCQGNIEYVMKKLFSTCYTTLNCMFVSVISNPGAVKGPTATYSQRVYLPDGMIPKYTGYVPSKYNIAITMAYVSTLSISGGKSCVSSPIQISVKMSRFFSISHWTCHVSFCVFAYFKFKAGSLRVPT